MFISIDVIADINLSMINVLTIKHAASFWQRVISKAFSKFTELLSKEDYNKWYTEVINKQRAALISKVDLIEEMN